jgi:quercetin dioxygenase-like cupin family protein
MTRTTGDPTMPPAETTDTTDPADTADTTDATGEADAADAAEATGPAGVVIDLGSVSTRGRPGVVWNLPHGGDLDANLVRLEPDGAIGAHRNHEVDVVLSVIAGHGELNVDDTTHPLRGDVLALVPRGARRAIRAGADGITYLSIHRRRGPLEISANPTSPDDT